MTGPIKVKIAQGQRIERLRRRHVNGVQTAVDRQFFRERDLNGLADALERSLDLMRLAQRLGDWR